MKRLIALLLVSVLFLTACNSGVKEDNNENTVKAIEDTTAIYNTDSDINPEDFSNLNDENLLSYVEE